MEKLKFDANGLITAVVQDDAGGGVLMVAWMNAKAIRLTQETGEAHFWSRSREEIWRKGSTSGNVMKVVKLLVDCDQDTILVQVNPSGPACHTGELSCFFQELRD
jgi:phosphoribosyl-AMP cyclohydrolase